MTLGRYADLCERSGRADDAVSLYRRLVQGSLERSEGALDVPSGAIESLARLKATAKVCMAMDRMLHGDDDEASRLSKEAVGLDPSFAWGHFYCGLLNGRRNAIEASEAAYRRAFALGDGTVRNSIERARPDLFRRLSQTRPGAVGEASAAGR